MKSGWKNRQKKKGNWGQRGPIPREQGYAMLGELVDDQVKDAKKHSPAWIENRLIEIQSSEERKQRIWHAMEAFSDELLSDLYWICRQDNSLDQIGEILTLIMHHRSVVNGPRH